MPQFPSILAIDTSGECCSVGLWHQEKLTELQAPGGAVASEHVLPLVRQILTQEQLALQQLQALAFAAGPGAFTGLRTAASLVQGLARGAELPVVPVGTLLGLVVQQGRSGRVAVAIDARMQEVYFAVYDVVPAIHGQNRVSEILAPSVASLDSAREQCHALGAVLGEISPLPALAGVIAQYAAHEYILGRALSAAQAQPCYVRHKVALTTAERTEVVQAK
jgi:tRNA threonylcarbamoyladenosine biosynthesis protein TsaB